jgi:hypothetical protein
MAKKVARKLKYFSPDTDYDELVDDLSSDEVDDYSDLKSAYEADMPSAQNKSSEGDISEDELREYLEWAKSTAQKQTTDKTKK